MKATAIRMYRGKERRTDYVNVTQVEPCTYTDIDGRKKAATRLYFSDHGPIIIVSPARVAVYA